MHPFLVYMKKYKGLNNYVWKLEFQKNGKLHVHLTTDSFINHSELRFYWNNLLKKNGYLDKFISEHKHDNPNSTDVHSVWKVKNLGAYIAKYLAKNEDSEGVINGRIWGCNYELSAKNKCVLHVPANELKEVLTELFNPIIAFSIALIIKPTAAVIATIKPVAEFISVSVGKCAIIINLKDYYFTLRLL